FTRCGGVTTNQLPLLLVCNPAHAAHTPAWLSTPLVSTCRFVLSPRRSGFLFLAMEAAVLLAGHLTGWRYNLDGYWGAMDFALEAFAAAALLHAGRFTTGQVPGVALGTLPAKPPPTPENLSPVALADQFLPAQVFTQGSDPIRRDVFLPLARDTWS